jgi:DNA-binding HxlR family transcriptional regulator
MLDREIAARHWREMGFFGCPRAFFHGKKRFSELKRAINGISSKSLTETLRHLEENNMLSREVYATFLPQSNIG